MRLASIGLIAVGCAGSGTSEVEPAALVDVLLSEDDAATLEMFGPRPMTIADEAESFYQEPWPACEASGSVDLHATDDIHVYFGDGGDYVYVKQWVSGETIAGATARFRAGMAAFEECVSANELEPLDIPDVMIDTDGIDQVMIYSQPGLGPDEYRWVTFARNGGILMTLFIDIFLTEAYTYEEAEGLVNVALERLAEIGSVGVKGSESAAAPESAATPTTPPTTSIKAPSTSAAQSTSDAPTSTSVQASTTSEGVATASAPSLTDSLPQLEGYTYRPWTQAETDAFVAAPHEGSRPEDPNVQEFAYGDVEHGGQFLGRIELYLLQPELHTTPDEVVLDVVAMLEFSPDLQSTTRQTISGERVLLRQIPGIIAWSWFEDGIVFNVIADGTDPVQAAEFVEAFLSAR